MNPSHDLVRFHEDIAAIKQRLGHNLKRIALFGSYSKDKLKARDIDIALFVDDTKLDQVVKRLSSTQLSLPIKCVSINGTYGSSKFDKSEKMLDYHIIILGHNQPNIEFMRINEATLEFL